MNFSRMTISELEEKADKLQEGREYTFGIREYSDVPNYRQVLINYIESHGG